MYRYSGVKPLIKKDYSLLGYEKCVDGITIKVFVSELKLDGKYTVTATAVTDYGKRTLVELGCKDLPAVKETLSNIEGYIRSMGREQFITQSYSDPLFVYEV